MSEPVEYQMRMRPTWEATSFSDWKKCSRDAFDDYTKTPKLHEWEYEVRKLYTSPPAQRTWVGLTDDEKRSVCRVGPVYAPDGVVTRNPLEYRKELQGVALMAVRQAEAQLKEKNT